MRRKFWATSHSSGRLFAFKNNLWNMSSFLGCADKIYQAFIFCTRLILELPIIVAILVLKVPGDLPMFAKRANFLRLSTALEFTFILCHFILVVVSVPFFLILFVSFYILENIAKLQLYFIKKFNLNLPTYLRTYIADITFSFVKCLEIVAKLGLRDRINSSLLLDMIKVRLDLAPRLLAFLGVNPNDPISPEAVRDVLPSSTEAHSRTPLSMIFIMLPQIVKFGEKDDVALARCVKILLSCGADIHADCSGLKASVEQASRAGHTETVKLLLINILQKNVGKLDQVTDSNLELKIEVFTAFSKLSEEDKQFVINSTTESRGNTERLGAAIDINSQYNFGQTLLHITIRKANLLANAEALLAAGADINLADQFGLTPLHCAADQGDVAVVELLLRQRGLNLNAIDWTEKTALHMLAQADNKPQERLQIIKSLLQAGINIDTQDSLGNTALYYLATGGRKEVMELLLEYNPNVSITNKAGFRVLDQARKRGRKDIVALLKRYSVSALHLAAKSGHIAVVTQLLRGINVNAQADGGWTALHLAAENGHAGVVDLLLDESCIDVNHLETDGWGALHLAAQNGHADVVNLLLQKTGIQVDLPTNAGQTALHLAAENNHIAVCRMLLISRARIVEQDQRKAELLNVLYALFEVSPVTKGQTEAYVARFKQFLHLYQNERLVRDDPVLTALFASGQVDLCKKLKAWGRAFASQGLVFKDQGSHGFTGYRNTYFEIPRQLCKGILTVYASVLSPDPAASSSDPAASSSDPTVLFSEQSVSSPEQAAWLKDLCVLITNDQPSASEDRSKTKITLNTALRLCTELLANAPYFYAADTIIDQVVSSGYSAIVELMLAKNTAIAEEEIARLIELAQAHEQDYTATRLMHIKARVATELSEGVQPLTAMPEAQLEQAAAEPEQKSEEAASARLGMGR